jgi:hypothetical protein
MLTRGAIASSIVVLLLAADPVPVQTPELPGLSERGLSPDPEMPRPIEAFDSVFKHNYVLRAATEAIAHAPAPRHGQVFDQWVSLAPPEETIALGKRLLEYQASVTAEAIRNTRRR